MISNPFSKLSGSQDSYSFSANDFRLILDQIQNPTLLVNLEKKLITAANYKFTQLTGIGSNEIAKTDIAHIILDWNEEKIADGAVSQFSVIRKNKNPVQIGIRTQYVSDAEKLALLIFLWDIDVNEELDSVNRNLYEKSVKIVESINELSFNELIEKIAEAGKKVFSAEHCVFYLQDKKNDDVRKIVTTGEDIFPDRIPAIEIKRYKQTDYWQPGKRVLSEIHRVGRLNNFNEIITLPIKINNDCHGLLAIAFRDKNIRSKYEKTISVFSEWINGIIKIQEEIKEIDKANKSVAVEINQYSQFFENASDCAVMLDDDNEILDINSNTAAFLKYSPIELLNQKAEVIFENSDIAKILKENGASIVKSQEKPVTIYDREGNQISIYYQIIPIEAMGINKKLLIIQDATVKVEAEKKIKQFQNKAAIGEVVADFAHEVRNPIHSFVSGIQIMKKKFEPEDALWKTLDSMHEDCLRINDLMESILSYSRQKVENFKDVNIELLIKRIFSQMNSKFKRSGVEALITSKTDNLIVYGDQRSLEQAFINLITNAYDAIKADGGVISVQIDKDASNADLMHVSVSDTGPGIPPEIRDKIFEPFVTDKPKGTGLGLAITKRMIEAHNGKIELETYPGGTIFKVILPITEKQGEQA